MANEAQYYNPIIQSMIAARQGNMDRAKLQQQAEQFKADKVIREHQLQLEETRAQHEHEHQTGMLDVQKALAEATVEMNRLNKIKAARDLSLGGVDVNKALTSTGGQPLQGVPGSEDLQAQEIQRIQSQAGAQTTGQMQAAQPFKEKEAQDAQARALELHKLDAENRMKEVQTHIGSAEKIAQLNADKSESVARINGGYHLAGIRAMHALGMGEQSDMAKQLVDGIFNGNRDYKTLTPDEKRLVEGYASGTGELKDLPTNQKEYQKKLESLGSVQTLLNQYRDLAVNFSRDSKDAFSKGNQNVTIPIIGTLQNTRSGSELQSKLDSMKASGGQLATYFDQQNRKSDAEILRQVLGSFDPKSTTKQNLQKLEQHTQQLQSAVKRTFGAMKPDRANAIMQQMGITDLGTEKPPEAEEYVRDSSGKLVLKGK